MRLPGTVRELRRAVGWHRRLLAGGLAAASVALAISALSPAPPVAVEVVTAGRDLPPGAVLTVADLATARLPPAVVPAGALRSTAGLPGRVLAAAARRGEVLTDVRLVGRSLLRLLDRDGLVAAPVRIADATSVALLQPGDLIDVVSAGPPGGLTADGGQLAQPPAAPTVAAAGATVLTVPAVAPEGIGGEGALVLLAVRPTVATDLARAAVTGRLSYTLRAR